MADVKGAIGKVEAAVKGAVEKVEDEVKKVVKEVEAEAIKFVNMFRDPSVYPAPHTAIVHPAEVDNYRPGGWITEDEAKAAVEAAAAPAPAADAPKA